MGMVKTTYKNYTIFILQLLLLKWSILQEKSLMKLQEKMHKNLWKETAGVTKT
jgi:hypothetical protein